MAWFGRKKDPLSARARALQAQIERLEAQIHDMSEPGADAPAKAQAAALGGPAVFRSHTSGGSFATPAAPPPPQPRPEQVFEKVDHQRLQSPPEAPQQGLYNELGVRKYDLPGAWQRVRNLFQGTAAQNPAFVKLLAAGNIQGLRPLRYEKRVARRRFIVFVIFLFLFLWFIIAMFLHG